jgi:glycosyltransferase involved in cell wall biosynthesis
LPPQIKEELSSYSKLIVSIGLFLPNYGFKQTIEGIETLRNNRNLDIGLVLIEGTSAIDTQYREAVLKNRDWVKVYTDIPQSQVIQLLQMADVYVRATLEESYGLSKIEALWSGTPVASTRQGETRGMTLFDRENPEQMIQAIEVVLLKPDRKEVHENAELFKKEAKINLNSYLLHLGLTHE